MNPAEFLSRRNLLIATGALLLAPKGRAAEAAHAAPAAHAGAGLTPEAAMARLVAGNARYVGGKATHTNYDARRRTTVAAGQHPFATVLACADSRVAPEIVFDQGLGELFTIRVAGNVVDDAILASIEYSVTHLGVSLIMVLGHERCGAVKATVDALGGHPDPADAGSKIGALAGLIAPAVKATPANAPDPIEAAVSLNAAHAAAEIFAGSPPLRACVLAGKLRIVAARYDLDDGKVTPTRAEHAA
ncbi:carbonic anhydrase [uncultured Phenylobacterium sp.]|uniref:carbonic anhydrase n=1 Tax=uncultured Phenylobacterium sp. TaxID=349273 RepID=UPI0025EF50E6|nr:carbonic anhydrase [uncultured Phenylobacterium sp.]